MIPLLLFAGVAAILPTERYVVTFTDRLALAVDFVGLTLTGPKGPLSAREAELLKGYEPPADGADPLDHLIPDGRLVRVERAAASPHAPALTAALFAALDADADGRLTRDEVKDAAAVLLKRFDADGDGCLTPLEVVPDLPTAVGTGAAGRVEGERAVRPGERLTEFRGREPSAAWALDVTTPTRKVRQVVGPVNVEGRPHFRWDVAVTPAVARPEAPKPLRRPGWEAELARYDAVAAEVVTMTLRPGPRGWWELLDADDDGQLSARELRSAWDRLADDPTADAGLTRPPGEFAALTVTVAPGTATRPPVRLVKRPRPPAGPDWFRALDRNGDGDLSAAEFVGTPAQFKTYDADGDGLIAAAEADAGDAKLKGVR